jgi:ribosomal protein S27AE
MTENGEFERGRDGRSTDIDTGGGTPDWLAAHLNYCSRCGSRLRYGAVEGEHRERLVCDTCGHIVYVNPRLVVTAFPVTDDGELVLLRRGIEPGYGTWAQPAGSSRSTRRSTRARSARPSRRPACSSSLARSSGCTRGSRRPS